jgi:transcriptional regulator with XRE-family HTH domain
MSEPRIVRARRTSKTTIGRRALDTRSRIATDIKQLREDAGASQRELAAEAGIDHGLLSLIERGLREPSITVLTAIASALGADVSVRLYPGTGPRIRDPIQARIIETLIGMLHPRWDRMLEVPVLRPARGFIDLTLVDRPPTHVIATEVQSEFRRIEQLIRWANQKALSIPSAQFWDQLPGKPRIDQLMVVRSTRTNREIAVRFGETLRVAYPASARAAYQALTTDVEPWPGAALLWADVRGDRVTVMDRPPRGVSVGG